MIAGKESLLPFSAFQQKLRRRLKQTGIWNGIFFSPIKINAHFLLGFCPFHLSFLMFHITLCFHASHQIPVNS